MIASTAFDQYHNTTKPLILQGNLACAFEKSKHNEDVITNMMSTDLNAFSDMATAEFPTLAAWVAHVQAHHAQCGDVGTALEPDISYVCGQSNSKR